MVFEVLILLFKILNSILSTLISSAKSEYDGTFSLFILYEWSSDAKGVADQEVLRVTVGCESLVNIDTGT